MTFIKKILPGIVLFSLALAILIPFSTSMAATSTTSTVTSPQDTLCGSLKHDLSRYVTGCTKDAPITADTPNGQLCCLLDLMETIIDYAFVILLIFAAVMIIWGAYMFVTAGGNTDKINAARDRLIWALVGVGVAIAAKGLVRVIENLLS